MLPSVDAPHAEVSNVARATAKIKKPWISIKSKFKRTLRIKPIQVISFPQRETETDPAPTSQEPTPPVGLSTSEDNHAEPSRSSLSSLPGFRKLNLASPTSKQATIEDAPSSTPLDHTPEVIAQPETSPQRQGTGSDDSVRSDEANFGDTQNDAVNHTARIAPNQHQRAPVQTIPPQIPQVQVTPIQNASNQAQPPLVNQTEKKVELAKLTIPERIPVFTPAHPKGTPLQIPGMPSPSPLTPSPCNKLLGLQNPRQKTPAMLANLFLSPSPAMIVPALGTPSPIQTISITPDTPIMPATPIKHQGRIPEVIGQFPNVVANQPPPLLPRSPRRPPPHGWLVPASPAAGENNFGVIGDHRVSRNQPQPNVVVEFKDETENKENVPLELELSPASDVVDGAQDSEDQDQDEPQPTERHSKPIYVGQKYYVGRYLGGGGMGDVYSVANRETMLLSALKVIKRKCLDTGNFSSVKDEWSSMKAISEAKFVNAGKVDGLRFVHHLMESWCDRDNVYFVMPLCVGSLIDHLKMAKFDPVTIKVYSAELMCGLEALHEMRIMHCDLKPGNILVHPDGHLSIADFGLSVSWLDPRYKRHPSHAFRGRRIAGTDGYMAPELVSAIQNPDGTRRGNYGFAADIWSMGVIIAELGMGGRRLVCFEDDEEKERWRNDYTNFTRAMVLSREKMMRKVRKYLQGDHAMLVERMVEVNEVSRPDFDEIASHPFFSDIDLGKVLARAYSVPIPPFEVVLPCRHTNVDSFWFSGRDEVEKRGETPPEDMLEHDKVRALSLTQDMDRFVIPEDFAWSIEKAIQLAMRKAH